MIRYSTMTALALMLAACAATPSAGLPAALAPDADETLLLSVAARGVQIYECRTAKAGDQTEWAFVAPEAELLDAGGRPVGSHGAGPSWQAQDGSRVVGSVKRRVDAPVAGTIPWLLVATRDGGPPGRFSRVTSIQRVNTTGGAAPASGCGPRSLGVNVRVPYTADYHLYARR